jgi:hypothetical protein
MRFNPSDYTTVFLSYDEPNCEENYQHLLTLNPNALRVHGIEGSDTAHKECAKLALTDRVVIVDGDNYVRADFYTTDIDIEYTDEDVISYSGYNIVNGTSYGNGGIKCWPVKHIVEMQTHENGSTDSIDFVLNKYIELNNIGSDLRINSSSLQAWRAGFREAIKLSQDENIDWRNYDRLYRWMHVGADIENGVYCLYGARLAYYMLKVNKWEGSHNVKNFDFLNKLYDHVTSLLTNSVLEEVNILGMIIREKTNDSNIGLALVDSANSNYRKQIRNPVRSTVNYVPEYDIVFIHNDELGAEENYNRIKERFPRAKELSGITGIHNAHIQAAKMCSTDYFWVVDGDAVIHDDFNFVYNSVHFYEQQTVRVFRAINPVNKLVYGHGAVKLLPRLATLRMSKGNVDMTTSISKLYEPINIVSNIHKFNTDAFSAWRTAFRECVKLSSKVIDRQQSSDSLERLYVWCSVGTEEQYGRETIRGALMGKVYGEANRNDSEKLAKINDYEWLSNEYNKQFQ